MRLDVYDSQDQTTLIDEAISDLNEEPTRRKRRKKRIRLTDQVIKAKKRFEKRIDKKEVKKIKFFFYI